jgi:hypothetical protein
VNTPKRAIYNDVCGHNSNVSIIRSLTGFSFYLTERSSGMIRISCARGILIFLQTGIVWLFVNLRLQFHERPKDIRHNFFVGMVEKIKVDDTDQDKRSCINPVTYHNSIETNDYRACEGKNHQGVGLGMPCMPTSSHWYTYVLHILKDMPKMSSSLQ